MHYTPEEKAAILAQAAQRRQAMQAALPQRPGLVQTMATGMAAAGRAIKAGMPLVSAGVRGQRQALCGVCPEFSNGICHQCGCITPVKTWLATEACPLKKW